MTAIPSLNRLKRRQRRAPDLEGGGLLSIETAARLLGVAPATLASWVRNRKLPHVRLGRRTLVRPERLAAFIDAHEVLSGPDEVA
jgi:excisionase family DNA binding protein